MTLREIKKTIIALRPRQLADLDAWLHELIDALEAKKVAGGATVRQVLEECKAVNKTYRLEKVRCGKKNCRCSRGELHGPYWYAYWTEGGKTRSEYVGKNLPRGVKKP
jgi:hypothetical protein